MSTSPNPVKHYSSISEPILKSTLVLVLVTLTEALELELKVDTNKSHFPVHRLHKPRKSTISIPSLHPT